MRDVTNRFINHLEEDNYLFCLWKKKKKKKRKKEKCKMSSVFVFINQRLFVVELLTLENWKIIHFIFLAVAKKKKLNDIFLTTLLIQLKLFVNSKNATAKRNYYYAIVSIFLFAKTGLFKQ